VPPGRGQLHGQRARTVLELYLETGLPGHVSNGFGIQLKENKLVLTCL
jgi:hypothetical protein